MSILNLVLMLCALSYSSFTGNQFNSPVTSDKDSLNLIEKVYLHVDRDTYYPGDDIWFKAYLIGAFDHLLTGHSSNLHVELISPDLKIISGRTIRLDGGLGNGDFKLPDDIRSGRYKIRAYTNYMRNFGDQLFFTKEITVINANDDQTGIRDEKKVVEKNISLTFFPEGGSLVSNISSLITFKAADNNGNGTDVLGKIYSSSGDIITKFKSSYLGMGSFFLRPLPGLKYYCIFRGSDSIDIRAELPAVFPTGITFSATKNQDDELLITIITNHETLAKLTENEMELGISIRKEIINVIRFRIKSTDTSFVVPTDYYPDGILCITLSTLEKLPLAERLVYIENETPLKINIETDKLIYKKREPVTMKISLTGDSLTEEVGNASLSVVNESFIINTSQYPRSISSWFLLESDVRGAIEDPSYYFDPSNTDRLEKLDLLLRTQGWRDFAWKYSSTFFPAENGFIISGSLINNHKNSHLKDSRVSIGIFRNENTEFIDVPVDSTGRFKISGLDLSGKTIFIVSGKDKKDKLEGLLTLDSVNYYPAKISESMYIENEIVEKNRNRLKSYYTINEAIKKKYKLSDTLKLGEVTIVSEKYKDPQSVKIESSRSKYGKPDAELIISESMNGYRNLPELMKGKFPGIEVIGPDMAGEYTIFFRGASTINGDPNPLVLIDGYEVNFEDLKDVSVSLIDRIDVLKTVASTTIYGLRGGLGVINLITKAGGVTGKYRKPDYSATLKISGYYASRLFYSPQHINDSTSDLKPDLRYTLFWNPDVNLESNKKTILNYYNGDNSSFIRIIAEGITKDGIPVAGSAKYEIR